MMNFRNMALILVMIGVLAPASYLAAAPVVLDFEDLSDSVDVGDSYASYGVHFSDAISLTADFSLNEFEYPPSSGVVAVGDDLGPLVITFDNPTSDISAYFTYASMLTFTAYDLSDSILGTFKTPTAYNLGHSEYTSLDFSNVTTLVIEGEWVGSFIMDDLGFNSATHTPEPSTLLLFGVGLAGLAGVGRKKRSTKEA